MARPRKELDRDQVEKFCYLQCKAEEIAGFYDVSVDTLDRRIKEWGFEGFADFFKKYSQGGKMSLRRYQYDAAKKGNVTMLIWLGKQYLGQSDKTEFVEGGVEFTDLTTMKPNDKPKAD